jgi:hypothetical protein
MVLLSFSKQEFIPLIKEGVKDQTCRPLYNITSSIFSNKSRAYQLANARKYELYFKSRTPDGFKIGDGFKKDFLFVVFSEEHIVQVKVNESLTGPLGKIPTYSWSFEPDKELACEDFATRDGFQNWEEMKQFFTNSYGPEAIGKMAFMVPRWDYQA